MKQPFHHSGMVHKLFFQTWLSAATTPPWPAITRPVDLPSTYSCRINRPNSELPLLKSAFAINSFSWFLLRRTLILILDEVSFINLRSSSHSWFTAGCTAFFPKKFPINILRFFVICICSLCDFNYSMNLGIKMYVEWGGTKKLDMVSCVSYKYTYEKHAPLYKYATDSRRHLWSDCLAYCNIIACQIEANQQPKFEYGSFHCTWLVISWFMLVKLFIEQFITCLMYSELLNKGEYLIPCFFYLISYYFYIF